MPIISPVVCTGYTYGINSKPIKQTILNDTYGIRTCLYLYNFVVFILNKKKNTQLHSVLQIVFFNKTIKYNNNIIYFEITYFYSRKLSKLSLIKTQTIIIFCDVRNFNQTLIETTLSRLRCCTRL